MMELFSNNGISYVAAAFFTGLFAFLGIIYKSTIENRKTSKEASEKVDSVSNGFTDKVTEDLDKILANQDRVEQALMNHLQWHVENPPRKRML